MTAAEAHHSSSQYSLPWGRQTDRTWRHLLPPSHYKPISSAGAISMNKASFVRSGHLPTLVSAFLYFDISFMVWVLVGPMTPFVADQFHLSATQKGLLTAVPLLGASFFRPILGLLADRLGGRRVGIIGLALTLVPLILGWR